MTAPPPRRLPGFIVPSYMKQAPAGMNLDLNLLRHDRAQPLATIDNLERKLEELHDEHYTKAMVYHFAASLCNSVNQFARAIPKC